MAERAARTSKGNTTAATKGGGPEGPGGGGKLRAAADAGSAKARAHKSATAAKPAAAKSKSAAAKKSAAGTEPPVQAKPRAAKSAETQQAEGATMVKPAESKTASRAAGKAPAEQTKPAADAGKKKGTRSAAETEKIRLALTARRDELQEEYDHTLTEITELQRDRLTDSAGDDQADTGTKTFEREQEITLANAILERVYQVERALERLDEGTYGYCERCGNPIPVERLAAFPSATLCVSCKQLEERR